VRCVLVFNCYLPSYCAPLVHRMCAVVSVVIPILETLAAQCALPALFYLREVTEDGSVLAGVELELPGDSAGVAPRRQFFWSTVWPGCLDAYDRAAIQAIRFLQGVYGVAVRDYNYDCMVAYRGSTRSAVVLAACAARRLGRLEREFARLVSVGSGLPIGQPPFDWHLLSSCLMTSVRHF
jgi:hypothetical protein